MNQNRRSGILHKMDIPSLDAYHSGYRRSITSTRAQLGNPRILKVLGIIYHRNNKRSRCLNLVHNLWSQNSQYMERLSDLVRKLIGDDSIRNKITLRAISKLFPQKIKIGSPSTVPILQIFPLLQLSTTMILIRKIMRQQSLPISYIIKDFMPAHQGLVNEGATCYLNSLIQTLFMTYEFRQKVYSYIHDPKKISQKDSIPYQLQKLFVNLQTKDSPCYTKQLLRSFQWNEVESFEQHDVQQFCRILFEAIEKTHKDSTWIKDLFGGVMNSYINCGNHISNREEVFLDISLPILNNLTQQSFSSLQESLKEFLRPESLEGVECAGCGAKVDVEKGLSLKMLPPIFTIQLNRFELNYTTFQRQKVNSFHYYPQILEMHRFMKPYGQIQIRQIPAALEKNTKVVKRQQSRRTVNNFSVDPVAKTKRKKSDEVQNKKEKVVFLDHEGKDQRQKQVKQLTAEEQKQKSKDILANLKADRQNIGKKKPKTTKVADKAEEDPKITPPSSYYLQSIEDDVLFGIGLSAEDWRAGATEKVPTFDKTQTKYEHEEQVFDKNKEYPDLTYALYAVLVHSGGSFGGHYFAYISDGQNWFRFDDSTVTKVTRFDIRRYGDNSSSTFGTNAYLLFYRDVKSFKELKQIQIPQQLREKVRLDDQKQVEIKNVINSSKERRFEQINQILVIKVFKSQNDFITFSIANKKEETLQKLRDLIKTELGISEKDENWRLRRYNKSDDTYHQIYERQLDACTLQSLGFREQVYLGVEKKTDSQVFEDYDPKRITIKVNVWRPNILLLTEKKMNPLRIPIMEYDSFQKLHQLIQTKTGLKDFIVLKRTFSIGNPIQILSLEENASKTLLQLRFFNQVIIYVQNKEIDGRIKWIQEFESQRYRCLIKYNNPLHSEARDEQIYYDTRKTLGDLKNQLSELIGISIDNFRIKKGKQALAQMTTYKKKLSDLRFVGTEILYLEQGKSSKGSILVKRAEVGIIQDRIEFTIHEEAQFEISAQLTTVGDLSQKIGELYGIPQQQVRIREYKNYEFKEIFSKLDQIQRIRQKSLVWEKVQSEQKGLQLYYRVFNVITFEFGPLREIYSDVAASYEELSLLLEQDSGIAHDKLLVWRPLSNYIDKEAMLDCEWVEIRFLRKTIRDEPLNIACDGTILIVKESEKSYKAKPIRANPQSNTKSQGGQARLRITVVEENQIVQESDPIIEQLVQAPKQNTSNTIVPE